MSALTVYHHTQQALRFIAALGKYMAIGRTSAWTDEQTPPTELSTTEAIDEPICYKPVAVQKFIVQDAQGEFFWANQIWRFVDPEDAMTEQATYVYIEAKLVGNEAPLTTYRQVACYTGLTPVPGAGLGVLLPASVADEGILEAYSNRKATPRASDKTDTIGLVLHF